MRAGSGVWALLRMQWRTAWLWLLLSPALLAALVVAIASGVKDLYGEEAERTIYAATMGASPAQIAMNGRGYDLDVLGGIAAYEVGFMGQLLLPLVGVLLAVRLTRAPESNGVLDLLTSTRVHRTAVPAAAFMSLVISWAVFKLGCWAGLVMLGYPATGSAGYSLAMAGFGLAWSGVGLLTPGGQHTAGREWPGPSAGPCRLPGQDDRGLAGLARCLDLPDELGGRGPPLG